MPEPTLKPAEKLLVGPVGGAALLDISRRQFDGLNTRGILPEPVRSLGGPKWSVAELQEWIAAGCPARERWAAMKSANTK